MQDEGQEPEVQEVLPPQAEPSGPVTEDDLIAALAERKGWSPDQVRGAIDLRGESERVYQESRQRMAELERRQRLLEEKESQLQRYQLPEFTDPQTRMLYDEVAAMRREHREERERREKEREEEQRLNMIGDALGSAYENLMAELEARGQKPIDKKRFFSTMDYLKPSLDNPRNAVLSTYGYLNSQLGLPGPQQNGSRSRPSPTTEIRIPSGATVPVTDDEDDPRRKPGESLEQYVMRLRARADKLQGTGRIPDGRRITVEN